MHVLPTVDIQKDFTATGTYDPFTSEGALLPLARPVGKWEIQVTGLDNAGAVQIPSAWDVLLLASINGLTFPDTSKILEHVNGTNNNGDVVWPTVSSISPFRDTRYIRIKVGTLTLGGSATKIRVNVRGF